MSGRNVFQVTISDSLRTTSTPLIAHVAIFPDLFDGLQHLFGERLSVDFGGMTKDFLDLTIPSLCCQPADRFGHKSGAAGKRKIHLTVLAPAHAE